MKVELKVEYSKKRKDTSAGRIGIVEQLLLKKNHPYPLFASQLKHLQTHINSKTNEKVSVVQVKTLVEIARRQWRMIDQPSQGYPFNYHEGPSMERFSERHVGKFIRKRIV